MTGHFSLDIAPESLRSAATRLRSLSEDLADRAEAVRRTPAEIGDEWTGSAAVAITGEMTGLARHLRDFSRELARTRTAVTTLATHYDDALDRLRSLNRQWREADEAYDAAVGAADRRHRETVDSIHTPTGGPPNRAVLMEIDDLRSAAHAAAAEERDAERSRLRTAFDDLRDDVRRWTARAATRISDAVPLPVPPAAIDAFRELHTYSFVLDRTRLESGMPLTRQMNALETADVLDGDKPGEEPSELEEFMADQWDKKYFTAADAAQVAGGELIALQRGILRGGAEALRAQAAIDEARYLLDGLDPESRAFYESQRYQNTTRAMELDARAARYGSRVLRTLPVVGWGITAAGIGYDVHSGKPPGKAIVTGLAGAGGAALAVAVASGPLGWGVIGVVAAGVGAGILVGYGAEKLWDALPDNVTDAIDDGFEVVGGAISDTAGDLKDGAEKVWDSIF